MAIKRITSTSVMKEDVKEKNKKWVAVVEFRDTNNYNTIYQVGEEVKHSDKREELGLIKLK